MSDSTYVAGKDLFEAWYQNILTGQPPRTWSLGEPFNHVQVGPGRIHLVGGPPGAGKTALLMQWVIEALALNPDLRVAVANVEMSPARLMDRQLARLASIPLTRILRRQFEPVDLLKRSKGFERIQAVVDRLAFAQGPYSLERVADVADDFGADLLVFDYLQRFELGGRYNGLREKINAMMSMLRNFASGGVGIIAAAALTRSRDSSGRSSYEGKHLGMASFRESSELEYGCDDAFLLYPIEDEDDEQAGNDGSIQPMMLSHVKSRDGELKSIALEFHRRFQKFKLLDDKGPAVPSVAASVNQVWQAGPAQQNPVEEPSHEQQADPAE
jgi:replicative DNA helicase